jgi:hypothetical protein
MRAEPIAPNERNLTMTTVLSGLNPQTRTTDNGFTVTEYLATGDDNRNALVETVAALFRDLPPNLVYDTPITILQYGRTMFGVPLIDVAEGRLFARDGYVAFLPKGKRTKGYRLKTENILAVARGFGHGDRLKQQVTRYADALPLAGPLTQEHLNALPSRGHTCTLAAVGTSPFYDGPLPGIWLLHSYLAEADIAEGVFVVPDGYGAVTEHGSVYGRDLLRRFAKVEGSISVPLSDALDYTFGRACRVAKETIR